MKNPNHEANAPEAAAIRQAMETLQGKSKAELMDAFKTATAQQRSAGMLNNEQMDDVFNTIAPLLSDGQRQRMASIFSDLRQ